LGPSKTRIFLQTGLDTQISGRPVGQISLRPFNNSEIADRHPLSQQQDFFNALSADGNYGERRPARFPRFAASTRFLEQFTHKPQRLLDARRAQLRTRSVLASSYHPVRCHWQDHYRCAGFFLHQAICHESVTMLRRVFFGRTGLDDETFEQKSIHDVRDRPMKFSPLEALMRQAQARSKSADLHVNRSAGAAFIRPRQDKARQRRQTEGMQA
jgi:hypothetical protein